MMLVAANAIPTPAFGNGCRAESEEMGHSDHNLIVVVRSDSIVTGRCVRVQTILRECDDMDAVRGTAPHKIPTLRAFTRHAPTLGFKRALSGHISKLHHESHDTITNQIVVVQIYQCTATDKYAM